MSIIILLRNPISVFCCAVSDAGGDFNEFLEGTFDGAGDITPGEYSQLKRMHGGDPFPMTASFEVTSKNCFSLPLTLHLPISLSLSIFFSLYIYI